MRKYLPYVVIVIYVILSLLPLLSSGYFSDDLVNSSLKGKLEIQNISLANGIKTAANKWLTEGRLFPLGLIITYTISYYISNLVIYKTMLMALVIINILLLGKLAERISGDRHVAFLIMLLIPLLYQFRLFYDPILSFCGFAQILMIFTLSSLIYFIKYLENNKLHDIIISLLFYNLTLYIYEISVPLIIAFVCVCYFFYSNKNIGIKLNKLIPHILSVTVYLIALLIIKQYRVQDASVYPGITINMDYKNILWTYIIQMTSSWPLIYYLANPSNLFNHEIGTIIDNITISDVTVMVIFMTCFWYTIRKIAFQKNINGFFYLGASFMLLPAMPIALTSKYQKELMSFGLGMGQLSVYIQYYGTMLILVGLIAVLINKISEDRTRLIMHFVLLTVFSTMLLLNIQNNRLVVDKSNTDVHYRRVALVRSLKEGILQDVPDNSKLVIHDIYDYDPKSQVKGLKMNSYHWENESLVYLYTKRKFEVMSTRGEEQKGFKFIEGHGIIDDNCYLLIIESYPAEKNIKDGFVSLYKIKSIEIDSEDNLKYKPAQLVSANYP